MAEQEKERKVIYLEDVIKEAAENPEGIIEEARLKREDSERKTEKRSGDKDGSDREKEKPARRSNKLILAEGFSQIEEQHRQGTADLFLFYSGSRRRQNRAPNFNLLRDGYFRTHNKTALSGSPERKELFDQGLTRLIEASYSNDPLQVSFHVLLDFWPNLLQKSPETISLWISSLDHIPNTKGRKGYRSKNLVDERLEGYIEVSAFQFRAYHPSFDHILRIFSGGRSIFGLENLMFDLTREQELDEAGVAEYFGNLETTPEGIRAEIEQVRSKLISPYGRPVPKTSQSERLEKIRHEKNAIVNKQIYDLFCVPSHTAFSQTALSSLLYRVSEEVEVETEEQMLESLPVLSEIIATDVTLMTKATARSAVEVSVEGNSSEKSLLRPYLEVVRHVARLQDSSENEKKSYLAFVTQMFKDYFRENKRASSDTVQQRCYESVNSIHGLDYDEREAALELLNLSRRQLNQHTRMNKQVRQPLYLDVVANSIVASISQDHSKAIEFINPVLSYRKEIREGGENGYR